MDLVPTPARRSARAARPRPPADSAWPGYRSTRCSPRTWPPRRRDDRPGSHGRGRRQVHHGRAVDRCGPRPRCHSRFFGSWRSRECRDIGIPSCCRLERTAATLRPVSRDTAESSIMPSKANSFSVHGFSGRGGFGRVPARTRARHSSLRAALSFPAPLSFCGATKPLPGLGSAGFPLRIAESFFRMAGVSACCLPSAAFPSGSRVGIKSRYNCFVPAVMRSTPSDFLHFQTVVSETPQW